MPIGQLIFEMTFGQSMKMRIGRFATRLGTADGLSL
jgi:hypothetical protein